MDDVLGWQQTRWGMTEAEIIEAVGNERLRRMSREDGSDWYADVTIQDVAVGDYSFNITFQMSKDTNCLQQVLIRHETSPDQEPTAEFRSARQILTERFGQPQRVGTSSSWSWAFPTTTIFLDTFWIEDIASFVAIRFKPSNAHDVNRSVSAF